MKSIRRHIHELLDSPQYTPIQELFKKTHYIKVGHIERSYQRHWEGIQYHPDMNEHERHHAHVHNYHNHLHMLAGHIMNKSKYHRYDPHFAYSNARNILHNIHGPDSPHPTPLTHLGHK